MKTRIITLTIIGLGVAGYIFFNKYKDKQFDKTCIKNGGRIIESGSTCELK
tara:strand:- start:9469 stop:9621 length:153 start_codon:yes stop_codon:yes gene_type:complete